MGLTRLSVMTIQGNGDNIVCEVFGHDRQTKKWAGAINLYKDGFFHTTVVSSSAAFDTAEKAVAFMKEIVQEVRKLDLKPAVQTMTETLGQETMAAATAIAAAAAGRKNS